MASAPSIAFPAPARVLPHEESPLPWRWFEFRQPPRAAQMPLSQDPHAVHAITIDGHTIPFKFFRRPALNGSPRPVLLMLHGMGLTIATYHDVAPYLLPTHDLLLPDYSGLSLERTPLPDFTSVKSFALSVWQLADALGVARLSLAGNSLGGGLCLMAALLQPQRVERILLANPACFPQMLPRAYRLAKVPLVGECLLGFTSPERLIAGVEYISYVDKQRFSPVLRAIYLENMRPWRNRLRLMQLIRQLPANGTDTTAVTHVSRLREIHHPVLVSFGLQDPLLAEGVGRRLADNLPGVTYEEYPDLAHMPHEEDPQRIGPRWARFLNSGQ